MSRRAKRPGAGRVVHAIEPYLRDDDVLSWTTLQRLEDAFSLFLSIVDGLAFYLSAKELGRIY